MPLAPPDPYAPKPEVPDDPIVDKISHVLLYKARVRNRNEFEPGRYELITVSSLDALLGGGGPPVPGRPVTAEGGVGGWRPLGLSGTQLQEAAAPAKPASDRPVPAASAQVRRTEFVIYFIWKEPIPSDKLRPGGGGVQ
jgi:hypothetical protein